MKAITGLPVPLRRLYELIYNRLMLLQTVSVIRLTKQTLTIYLDHNKTADMDRVGLICSH